MGAVPLAIAVEVTTWTWASNRRGNKAMSFTRNMVRSVVAKKNRKALAKGF
jgi:hypothetical protein|tara:strand:+ start:2099 stop:2251 length:153 start_codon:yes stop_codon:yes gene_type:complete